MRRYFFSEIFYFLKIIVLIFLLSLKFSERFLLLLPPGLNFGDNKLLLPKYETFTLKCLLDVQSIASCNSKGFVILYYKKVGKRKYCLQLHCLFHSKKQQNGWNKAILYLFLWHIAFSIFSLNWFTLIK